MVVFSSTVERGRSAINSTPLKSTELNSSMVNCSESSSRAGSSLITMARHCLLMSPGPRAGKVRGDGPMKSAGSERRGGGGGEEGGGGRGGLQYVHSASFLGT